MMKKFCAAMMMVILLLSTNVALAAPFKGNWTQSFIVGMGNHYLITHTPNMIIMEDRLDKGADVWGGDKNYFQKASWNNTTISIDMTREEFKSALEIMFRDW